MPDSWVSTLTGPLLHLVFLASIFDIHFKSPIVQGTVTNHHNYECGVLVFCFQVLHGQKVIK